MAINKLCKLCGVLFFIIQHVSTLSSSSNRLNLTTNKKFMTTPDYGCEQEYQEIGNTTLLWTEILEDLFWSAPYCIAPDSFIAFRQCLETNDLDEVNCTSVQKPISPCPPNMIQVYIFCFLLIEGTYESDVCPYSNYLSFDEYREYIPSFNLSDIIWYPARRNNTYGIGLYVRDDFGNDYGTFSSTSILENDIYDCLAYSDRTLFGISCDSKLKWLCVYHLLSHSNSYCSQINFNCKNAFYNTSIEICHCLKSSAEEGDVLAELTEPFQNEIKISSDMWAIIGLKRINGIFQWAASRTALTYTYWSTYMQSFPGFNEDCSQAVIGKNGWECIENHSNVRESLVQVDYSLLEPRISLQYRKNNKQVDIKVESTTSLRFTKSKIRIFCFTTAQHGYPFILILTFTVDDYTDGFKVGYTGYYWCEAFPFNKKKVSSGLFIDLEENIYALDLNILYPSKTDPTSQNFVYHEFIKKIAISYNTNSKDNDVTHFKWAQTYKIQIDLKLATYTLHIISPKKLSSSEMTNVLHRVRDIVKIIGYTLKQSAGLFNMTHCLNTTIKIGKKSFTWEEAPIGSVRTSNELCKDKDENEITRFCYGNWTIGARWSDLINLCVIDDEGDDECEQCSKYTQDLRDLLHSNESNREKSNNLNEIVKNYDELIATDVSLVSMILEQLSNNSDSCDLNDITEVVSNLMHIESEILVQVQNESGTANHILKIFDNIVSDQQELNDNNFYAQSNLKLFIYNFKKIEVRGVAYILKNGEFELKLILKNETLDDVINISNLETGVYIPDDILFENNVSSEFISFALFMNLKLFIENKVNPSIDYAKPMSVLLPAANFGEPIYVFFKIDKKYKNKLKSCSYWNLKNSFWATESNITLKNNLLICEYLHVTHFGLLILKQIIISSSSGADIIGIIASTLSILGYIGIFLTAVLFKSYRKKVGNQVLLHYSFISLLQTIFLVALNFVDRTIYAQCLAFGLMIHYCSISQSVWTLLISILQYQRYVLVLYMPNRYVVLRFCLLGYFVPLIPVVLLSTVNADSYQNSAYDICFPSDNGLYYAFLMPQCILSLCTFSMFIRIVCELSKKDKTHETGKNKIKFIFLKFKVIILLFFLLNISWGMSFVFTFTDDERIMNILSTFTKFQGLVIFLFFIVFNKDARSLYLNLFKRHKLFMGLNRG